MSSHALTVRAGREALQTLRNGGFRADAFSTLLGASGGPKWLVLASMDRVLARHLVAGRTRPLHALGTSIGAFRHLCHAQRNPQVAFERFEEAYVGQAYEKKPTPSEVTEVSRRIFDVMIGETGIEEALGHPTLRLHVGAVRGRGPLGSDARARLAFGLGAAATANAISRRMLGMFFERVVFHSGDAPGMVFADVRTSNVRLTAANLRDATLASGSIPLVMAAIQNIEGAPPGLYRDGGITDYHFAMDFQAPDGLVLYPHFFDRIVPGWFDKPLSWRKARGRLLDRTLFLAPSREFVASLPGGKVPDRDDFVTHRTAERQRTWKRVLSECTRLADELHELIENDRIADVARPFA
ncbi:MAG TPA: patatin-like phospholipase family protein [Candidatus Binatia bacterium]|nr:patatin-like phospholipase family protein [Candidatus Binatia bacterium]